MSLILGVNYAGVANKAMMLSVFMLCVVVPNKYLIVMILRMVFFSNRS